MKIKLAIIGCLVIAAAGVWYLLTQNRSVEEMEGTEPVGPILGHELAQESEPDQTHLRVVMHEAKELAL
jgi:hypothetical protein